MISPHLSAEWLIGAPQNVPSSIRVEAGAFGLRTLIQHFDRPGIERASAHAKTEALSSPRSLRGFERPRSRHTASTMSGKRGVRSLPGQL
jgi:hypothetical protein